MTTQHKWTAISGDLYEEFVSPENRCVGSPQTATC